MLPCHKMQLAGRKMFWFPHFSSLQCYIYICDIYSSQQYVGVRECGVFTCFYPSTHLCFSVRTWSHAPYLYSPRQVRIWSKRPPTPGGSHHVHVVISVVRTGQDVPCNCWDQVHEQVHWLENGLRNGSSQRAQPGDGASAGALVGDLCTREKPRLDWIYVTIA